MAYDIPAIMVQGISLASEYFVGLIPGTPNKASGNCAIESVLDQINSRNCFDNKLDASAEYYREIWMDQTEALARKSSFYPGNLSEEEWTDGWDKLTKDGQYEVDYLGELMMIGIMHFIKKHAIIFNVSESKEHGMPISVIRADKFEGSEDSDIPIVLVYNGYHYASLLPATDLDVQKTIHIVHEWQHFSGSNIHEHLKTIGWFEDSQTLNGSHLESFTSNDLSDSSNPATSKKQKRASRHSDSTAECPKITVTIDGQMHEITLDSEGNFKCPSCRGKFKRLLFHLKSTAACTGKIDMQAFEKSYQAFIKAQRRAKARTNTANMRARHSQEHREYLREEARKRMQDHRKRLSEEERQSVKDGTKRWMQEYRKRLSEEERRAVNEETKRWMQEYRKRLGEEGRQAPTNEAERWMEEQWRWQNEEEDNKAFYSSQMSGARDALLWERANDEHGFSSDRQDESSNPASSEQYMTPENCPIKEEMVEWVDEGLVVNEDNDKSREEDTHSPVFPGVHVILNEAPGPARKKKKSHFEDVQNSNRESYNAFHNDPLTVPKGHERNVKSPPAEQQGSEEEEDLFGRYVAATIKKFSSRSRSIAKMRIQHVLFEVEEAERLGKDYSLNISINNGN